MNKIFQAKSSKIASLKAVTLLKDRRGFAALLLIFTLIPLVMATGIAVEYGQAQQNQSNLNAAADSAALVATTTAANLFSAGTTPSYITQGEAAGTSWFNSEVTQLGLTTPPQVNINIVQSKTVFNTTLTYAAQMPTNFGNIFGSKMFAINGQSNATITVPGYLDVHVLMDVSSSMDIIASPTNFAAWGTFLKTNYLKVYKNEAQNYPCAFACHYTAPASDGAPSMHDIAEANGFTLRIDVLRSAVKNLVTTMTTADKGTNFRIGMYEFNTAETTIFPISSNLAVAATTAQTIDTPITTKSTHDTDFETSMGTVDTIIQSGGDGMSAHTPKEVLFIITDGVDNNTNIIPNQGTFNPAACASLKNRGVRIMVLYTQYYEVYVGLPDQWNPSGSPNGTWLQEVAPITPEIEPALQACATSSSDFFVATDGASINTALQQMLQASLATPGRYTK